MRRMWALSGAAAVAVVLPMVIATPHASGDDASPCAAVPDREDGRDVPEHDPAQAKSADVDGGDSVSCDQGGKALHSEQAAGSSAVLGAPSTTASTSTSTTSAPTASTTSTPAAKTAEGLAAAAVEATASPGAVGRVARLPEQTPDTLNCENFHVQEDAQAEFNKDPRDPHRLDQGGQPGLACEHLPRRLAAGASSPTTRASATTTTKAPAAAVANTGTEPFGPTPARRRARHARCGHGRGRPAAAPARRGRVGVRLDLVKFRPAAEGSGAGIRTQNLTVNSRLLCR